MHKRLLNVSALQQPQSLLLPPAYQPNCPLISQFAQQGKMAALAAADPVYGFA